MQPATRKHRSYRYQQQGQAQGRTQIAPDISKSNAPPSSTASLHRPRAQKRAWTQSPCGGALVVALSPPRPPPPSPRPRPAGHRPRAPPRPPPPRPRKTSPSFRLRRVHRIRCGLARLCGLTADTIGPQGHAQQLGNRLDKQIPSHDDASVVVRRRKRVEDRHEEAQEDLSRYRDVAG